VNLRVVLSRIVLLAVAVVLAVGPTIACRTHTRLKCVPNTEGGQGGGRNNPLSTDAQHREDILKVASACITTRYRS